MPAIITHHLFGEDIVAELPAGLIDGEEELLAFLLGNQGPDPLYVRFLTLPSRAAAIRQVAAAIQGSRVTRAFLAVRDGVSHLPASDERVGRAFALGLLGHYALDRAAHPFVISQQRAICGLEDSLGRARAEVHAVIESDIDTWILWEKRRATVQERPAVDYLMRTDKIERVGGALFSQVALSVYGMPLSAGEYTACLRDYELLYRLIDPAGSPRTRTVAILERTVRRHSLAEAMAHYVRRSDDCPAANLDCLPWQHPFTGEVRHESFADLFDEARLAYPTLAEAFVRGDERNLRELAATLNYEGRPETDPA